MQRYILLNMGSNKLVYLYCSQTVIRYCSQSVLIVSLGNLFVGDGHNERYKFNLTYITSQTGCIAKLEQIGGLDKQVA